MLSAEIIHGFTKSLLARKFDSPKPTPEFHLEMWEYCCSKNPYVAIAAPRGHAKSTAITLCYVLAAVLFREHDYVWIISDTETQSIQFLQDLKMELLENEELKNLFQVSGKLIKDNEKDIIVSIGPDKHKFRITAKSSGTSIRGGKWNNKRPNLIVGDDLENDEMVESLDRREKFRNWFFSAIIPALADDGKVRIVGTILRFSSFLAGLMPTIKGVGSEFTVIEPLKTYNTAPNCVWKSILFKAHPGIDDFSSILWEKKFSEARLKKIRAAYIAQGYPEGYSAEYLNDPIDAQHAFFFKDDFLSMTDKDFELNMNFYIGTDFAVSVQERSDFSCLLVAGMDEEGMLYIVDVRKGRWNTKQIIEELFNLQKAYNPDIFVFEKGVIDHAIGPFLQDEMLRKNRLILNIEKVTRTKDKRVEARSIQGRMRAHGVKFYKEGSWYLDFEEELLRFDKGAHDDQVDAFANLGKFLNKMSEAPTKQMVEIMEYEEDLQKGEDANEMGRSKATGY